MSKTVRQVADLLQISRQAVHVKMDKIEGFRDEHIHKQGNKFLIDDEGVEILVKDSDLPEEENTTTADTSDTTETSEQTSTSETSKVSETSSTSNDDESDAKEDEPSDDYAQLLIESLKAQIATQERELESRRDESKEMHKLLDQQQQLQLATTQENRQLKDQIQSLGGYLTTKEDSSDKKDDKSNNVKQTQEETKKGFWAKLFH